MKELIEEIAKKLSEFLEVREIRQMSGGSVATPPYYMINRVTTVWNNFELSLLLEGVEYEFVGDASTILDRLKELFLGEDE